MKENKIFKGIIVAAVLFVAVFVVMGLFKSMRTSTVNMETFSPELATGNQHIQIESDNTANRDTLSLNQKVGSSSSLTNVYASSSLGLSFRYPDGWTVEERDPCSTDISYNHSCSTRIAKYPQFMFKHIVLRHGTRYISLRVTTDPATVNSNEMSPDGVVKLFVAGAEAWRSSKPNDCDDPEISSGSCYDIYFPDLKQKTEYGGYNVNGLIVSHGRKYTITYQVSESHSEPQQPLDEFDQIVQTITFI